MSFFMQKKWDARYRREGGVDTVTGYYGGYVYFYDAKKTVSPERKG